MNHTDAGALISMISGIEREDWEIIKKIIDEEFDNINQIYEERKKTGERYCKVADKLSELKPDKYKEENLND